MKTGSHFLKVIFALCLIFVTSGHGQPGITGVHFHRRAAAGGGGGGGGAPTADYLQWKINDGSGTTLADSSGNSRDGTIGGLGSSWVTGQDGVSTHAVNLNQSIGFTSAKRNGMAQLAYPFTMTIWVKTTANNGVAFGQFDATQGNWFADYIFIRSDGTPTCSSGQNNVFAEAICATAVNDGVNWHLLAGVWASATSRTIYVDGISRGTDTTSLTPTGINSVCIGAMNGSSPGADLTGSYDDARMYSSALSGAQILAIFNANAQ